MHSHSPLKNFVLVGLGLLFLYRACQCLTGNDDGESSI